MLSATAAACSSDSTKPGAGVTAATTRTTAAFGCRRCGFWSGEEEDCKLTNCKLQFVLNSWEASMVRAFLVFVAILGALGVGFGAGSAHDPVAASRAIGIGVAL